jgi:zinc transport system substrate-binding protein
MVSQHTSGGDRDPQKLQVVASYYPLYDFARAVGGDKVQVTNVTPAGAEPHEYEPAPRMLAAAQQADVFIYNGGSMEPWVDAFLRDYKHTAVKASESMNLQTAVDEADPSKQVSDPHFWLDPVLAQKIVDSVQRGFADADPANAAYYAQQAEQYKSQLTALDADYRQGLANCQTRMVISSHDAFSYVGARYGLTIVPIAGLSPDVEPSAAKLAELSRLVEAQGLEYVFFESLASSRLADTIAAETGAKTLVFDPIEGLTDAQQKQGKNYLSIQHENIKNLRTALACE